MSAHMQPCVPARPWRGASRVRRGRCAGDVRLVCACALTAPAVRLWRQNGNTPLHLAAANGSLDCLRLLLDAGADVHAPGNVRCAAAPAGGTGAAATTLSHRACSASDTAAGAARQQGGWTPLHYAAMKGHSEALSLLLEREADANAQTKVRAAPRAFTRPGGRCRARQR